ncbi:ferrochelatase [Sediminibacterium goheungense]|uniref:Ferrochelatase n=1 Tax=Sediminibacterium goheungense TaxID=1086393 RepID=A0A4R6J391_9BACT|nr:ferrochelatase [Sediminibacterium goheungense]TDO28746.1 ferrochelatase [Sediminibacterium goheungense]
MATKAKRALLLMNLGSPDSTAVKDVRRYLNEFLMDGRVIDIPYLVRVLLVKGIIVPFRAPKSAEAYRSIWTKEGSPLIVLTKQLQEALQHQIVEPVAIAMRYGNPSPKQAYDHLLKEHPELEEVVLLPLYPHYAMSSYETAVEYAKEQYEKGHYPFKLHTIQPFYDDADYIDALAQSIQPYTEEAYDHILFSYHGVPQRHIRKSDTTGCHCLKVNNCCETASPAHATCYRHQLVVTTKLVAEKLGIPKEKYSISFQSRLGKGWLEPFTDKRLEAMPGEGIKKLLVACPAFISDCLETIEEIGEEGKETFLHAGGESFTLIPCLNTHPAWVNTIVKKFGNLEMS